MKDQLTEPSADGYPVNNAPYDCVPTSFAAAIQYYTGDFVTGQELKDAEYGATYANAGTALWRYVDQATDMARQRWGCSAVAFSASTGAELVSRIHTLLQVGFPVVATIPSGWNTAYPQSELNNPTFPTHVIVFYSEEGGLTAMNPWHGFKQTEPDLWWEERLCYGQVWQVVQENAMTIVLSDVSSYFTADPTVTGQWDCKNGKSVHGSILSYYRSYGGRALCGLSFLGLPLTNELAPDATYAGRVQVFERGAIVYDPQRKWDTPPGVPTTDACYTAHVDQGFVNKWLTAALQSQLTQLQGQLAAVQGQLTAAQSQEASDKTVIDALNTQVTNLNSQITTLQAQVSQLEQTPPPPDAKTALALLTQVLTKDGEL